MSHSRDRRGSRGQLKKEAVKETNTTTCEFLKCEKRKQTADGRLMTQRYPDVTRAGVSDNSGEVGGFEDSPRGLRSPTRRSSCGWHVLCHLHIPASTPTSS